MTKKLIRANITEMLSKENFTLKQLESISNFMKSTVLTENHLELEKLIFEYESTDGCTYSCTNTIPFEYSSVMEFQLMVLDKVEEYKQKCILDYGRKDGNIWYRNGHIKILDTEINVGHLIDNIDNVFTLDEWFNKNKTNER